MYVLDTNVVSELRKVRFGKADAQVAKWADSVEAVSLYVSAITILELEIGVLQMEAATPAKARCCVHGWITMYCQSLLERVLPVDTAVAQRCARLHVPDRRAERDALIAATALVHGMTIVTRNLADFEPTGVPVLNPWSDSRDR
jgi:predicted nucleic acid-binding protein